MRIDQLTETDLDAAVGLSREAGWNQLDTDWRRLLAHPDARCFAGRVDGELVATATAITFDDRVCWIGMVLVDGDHRRRGYGTAIFERALDHATDVADAVGLDATSAGRPLYRDLGFLDVTDVERRTGVLTDRREADSNEGSDAPPVKRIGEGRDAVAALDEYRSGADRRALLDALLDEPRTTGLLAESDGDRGYTVVRPGRDHWQLGPVVADSRETLRALLTAAADELGGESVLVDALRSESADLFADRGLTVDRALTRMSHRRAEPLLCGDAVHAAVGLELG